MVLFLLLLLLLSWGKGLATPAAALACEPDEAHAAFVFVAQSLRSSLAVIVITDKRAVNSSSIFYGVPSTGPSIRAVIPP